MSTGSVAVETRRRLLDPRFPRFALQLSILSFIVVVHSDPRRAAAGAVIAIVGLVVPGLIEKAWFWWTITGIMAGWFLLEWPVLDNHVALSVFWAAAVAIALGSDDWRATLRHSGRWIIVTVFGLAVFWKVVSPDFLSAAFFEWTLLVDPRFEPLTRLLAMPEATLAANLDLVASALSGSLGVSTAVQAASVALTAGTIVLESAVAVTWALGERSGNLRHWMLASFAVVTYVLVPVAGFGFMLLVIGAATVETATGRRNYAIGALALFVYSVIWNLIVLG